jgi:hypothetical protein
MCSRAIGEVVVWSKRQFYTSVALIFISIAMSISHYSSYVGVVADASCDPNSVTLCYEGVFTSASFHAGTPEGNLFVTVIMLFTVGTAAYTIWDFNSKSMILAWLCCTFLNYTISNDNQITPNTPSVVSTTGTDGLITTNKCLIYDGLGIKALTCFSPSENENKFIAIHGPGPWYHACPYNVDMSCNKVLAEAIKPVETMDIAEKFLIGIGFLLSLYVFSKGDPHDIAQKQGLDLNKLEKEWLEREAKKKKIKEIKEKRRRERERKMKEEGKVPDLSDMSDSESSDSDIDDLEFQIVKKSSSKKLVSSKSDEPETAATAESKA